MGKVVHPDFGELDAEQRALEIHEARQIAETSPDLVLAAPALRDFLIIVRNDVKERHNEIYPAVESLLEWLQQRDPIPCQPSPPVS